MADGSANTLDQCRKLIAAGRARESMPTLEALLASEPANVQVLHYYAVALHLTGRSLEAIPYFDRALELEPLLGNLHLNRSTALLAGGRLEDAVEAAREAVRLRPHVPAAYVGLALAECRAALYADAWETVSKGLEQAPDHPGLLNQAAHIATEARNLPLAENYMERALEHAPNNPEVIFNSGVLHQAQSRHEEALRAYDRTLAIQPHHEGAFANRAVVLRSLGRVGEAMRQFRIGLARKPDWPILRYNLALTELLVGNWEKAWPDFDLRMKLEGPPDKSTNPESPLWNGSDISNETLFVTHEQGLGETLQFLRFLPFARQKAARVIFMCQERLYPLLSRLDLFRGGDIELLSDSMQIPPHDVRVPLMSLARLYGATPENIPQMIARITLEEPRFSQWAAFGRRDARSWRIGLAWQGNPDASADRDRSMPPAEFATLGPLSDRVTFISLQKHSGHDRPVPEGLAIPPADFDTGRDAFIDSAALMQSLDLVITTDTAMAHLAGLLGRPVWLLLNAVPYWRWGLEGTLTGWYPTMRVFRQPAPGDWPGLMTDVAAQLGELFGEGSHDPQRLNSRAMAILESGQRNRRAAEIALPLAGHLVAMHPRQADLWSNFSVLLDCLGSAADSRRALRFALTAEPGQIPSRVALAKKLSAVGKASEATSMLRDVLAREPDIAAAHSAMAAVLSDLKRYKSAETAMRTALAIEPKNARLWVQLGAIQSDARRHRQAAESWEHALAIDPTNADAFSNLCANERNFGEVEIACWYGRRAVECDPAHADAWSNFGVAELDAGREDSAIQAFRKAIEIQGDHADAHLALGMALLSRGDFTAGLKHYEGRLASRTLGIAAARPNLPFWRGGDPKGLAILLMAEQGLGDAFQFVRYARWLKERGAAKVYVGCPKRIAHLLGTVPGVDGVVTQGDKLPAVGAMAYMMSMPLLTGMQLETIPSFDSYIDADPERVTRWAQWLAERPGYRVGIVWQGNPDRGVGRGHSFPLAALEPLARVPGVRLISLQKGPGEEQVEALAGRFEVERPGQDFDGGPDAFADTAALIMNLDLVVTSDTAVAHLAGALGKPCWVVLEANPEWRWLLGRSDSPWYPNTRLFRRVRGEVEDAPFAGVMGRVASAIEKLVAGDVDLHHVTALPENIEVQPFEAVTTYNSALKAHRAKDDATARPLFAAVLKVPKLKPLALKMLGTVALHADRNHRAAIFFDGAERAGLDSPELLTNHAISLRRIGDSDGAIRKLEAVIAKSPTPQSHLTLANIHRDACDFEPSLANYRASIALKPEFAKAHRGLANLMRDMHRPEDSLAAFERAREIAPKDPDLILDHAHAKLFAGDFIGGFRDYEYRWQGKESRPRDFVEPRWNGEVAPGKVLLIHGEQGFGDNIQFVRFVDEASRRVGRVILEVRGPLVGLMKNLETERPLTVMEEGKPAGKFDLQIPMMSLPMAFGTTLETIPPPLHFRLDPERVAAWKERFPSEGIRIGLVWQGNPKAKADAGRSPPFSALTPLFSLPGAHFVALQKTDGLEQLRRSGFADRITAPGEALGDFLETAHAVAALDLVVSSCSATLHLAATMGVSVYGMLKYHADWRWLNEVDSSPWYPSLRLFRQRTPGDWDAVVTAIRAALAEQIVAA